MHDANAATALRGWLQQRTAENRSRLVYAHAYLCVRAARKFKRPGLESCDLEQVATVGLLKACDRYQVEIGTPFEAYAWLFVIGELMHYVRDWERPIRPPRKLRALELKMRRASATLAGTLGRKPTGCELRRPFRNHGRGTGGSRRMCCAIDCGFARIDRRTFPQSCI